jgi:hypothetical protein
MRLDYRALWAACIALAAVWPLPPARGQQEGPIRPKPDTAAAQTGEQSTEDATKPPEGDGKDTRLALKDIQRLRHERVSPEQVVENVAEQGRAFEVTAEVAGELRRLGFRPAQIDAIKDSSSEPLVPGKWLTTSDEQRNQILKEMKQVAIKSKAAIEPMESQHVTLWAAKETQKTYLRDVQKLEKFFHTKCAEPIRSGLDKRSTHIVLLKDHAEYQAWCRAMFDLFGERFDEKDNPGGNAEFRSRALKGWELNWWASDWWHFSAISVGEVSPEWARREVAANVGGMCFVQLAGPPRCDPLETGFADSAEAAVAGWPSVMYSKRNYHEEDRNLGADSRAWVLLVEQRMAMHRATPLGKLLEMDTHNMLQPHFAEGWTLVGLLNKQPVKFGKLLLAIREGDSELKAIEKVYGWDEKKLTQQWRAYVMGQGKKAVRNPD